MEHTIIMAYLINYFFNSNNKHLVRCESSDNFLTTKFHSDWKRNKRRDRDCVSLLVF